MRVISFHAYKGGRGRTTAIASIANLYARTGKNVALLDADVTAPWLHTRYEISPETLQSRGWLRGMLRRIASTPASVVPAVDLDDYSIRIDGAEHGSVRLFAPGNPVTTDYWKWMAEEFPRFLGIRADPHITESWRDLRAMIECAEPRPDVLLIDAPAGYHEASAYIAMAIADTAVFFAHEESPDPEWTTRMVTMMREARLEETADRYGRLSLIGVRSRYPGYIHPDFGADERFRAFQRPYAAAGFDRWVSLESDPRVELDDKDNTVPIPLRGPIRRTRLVEGYAELLAVALGEEQLDASTLFERLPEHDIIPGERPQFFLLAERGILTNPADQARNVSFRVETFCALLDDLHKELMGSSPGSADKASTTVRALKKAGHDPGKRFGESLGEQLNDLDPPPDDEARIRRWCEFDSRVGFGGLTLERLEQSPEGDAIAGTILVEGNFLAAGRPVDSPDLCSLLNGYIEGVLSMLLRSMPAPVKVEHSDDRCIRVHHDRSSCEFDFSVLKQPAAAAE
jgi:cellulose biosynthesis protein BcsQ